MKLSLAGNKPGLASNRGKQQSTSKNAFGGAPSSTQASSSSKKPLVFGDDDDDEEEDGMPGSSSSKPLSKLEQKKRSDPSRLAQGLKGLSTPSLDAPSSNTTEVTKSNNSKILAKLHAEAKSIDPTIFSYDEVYDTMKSAQALAIAERKKLKEEEGDTPKYVSGLLKAAELRKKDRIRAEDKLIEREREKEGEDFKDKDAFVTQAYKDQQEELRKMEEEEALKEEQAAKRPGGMSEYYKRELAQSEAIHEAAMKAASSAATASTSNAAASSATTGKAMTEEQKLKAELTAHGPKSEAAIAEEASKALGRDVTINEEGQIVDKRELLTGGLNIKPKKVYGASNNPNETAKKGGFALSIAERKSALEEIKAKENERKQREDEASIGMTGLTMAERQKISRERQSKELERQMLLAQERKRKAEEEKESELEKKIKVRKNDETKIEEMKRKALERRMQKKKEEEEAKTSQMQS